MQAPIDNIDDYWSTAEKYQASRMLKYSFVGARETVGRALQEFAELTQADELMIVTSTYDHAARLRSYEIVAQISKQTPV